MTKNNSGKSGAPNLIQGLRHHSNKNAPDLRHRGEGWDAPWAWDSRSDHVEGQVGVSWAKRKEGASQAEGTGSSKALLQGEHIRTPPRGRPRGLVVHVKSFVSIPSAMGIH